MSLAFLAILFCFAQAFSVTLSRDEAVVDAYMHSLEVADAKDGIWSPRSQHDYATLKRLAGTELHRLIDEMPKGTMLHCHRSACFNYSEVVHQIVAENPSYAQKYGAQVYIYNKTNAATERDGKQKLFADVLCPNEAFEYEATLMQDADLNALIGYWSLENLDMRSMTDAQIWHEFELRFDLPKEAFRWEPVAQELVMPSLVNDAVRHGISYLEPIGSLGKIYNKTCNAAGDQKDYSKWSAVEEVNMWDTYTKGLGSGSPAVNLICSSFRGSSNMIAELTKCIDLWKATKSNRHTRVVAFDIVGREDRFGLAEGLLDVWEKARDEGIPVAPHAGETIFPESLPTPFLSKSPASNLRVHAKYANTNRVGHAISLQTMEPQLVEQFISNEIAVIATPVSNQLLGYVQSSVFHQACELHLAGVQVALSPDDAPIFSRVHSVSHDFGYVFRSCQGCGGGLGMLKAMIEVGWDKALLDPQAKKAKKDEWLAAWDAWIANKASQICASAQPPSACNNSGASPQCPTTTTAPSAPGVVRNRCNPSIGSNPSGTGIVSSDSGGRTDLFVAVFLIVQIAEHL